MIRPMRLIAVPLLLLAPCLAQAQVATQLRLSWDHCAGEGKVADRSFACDTNTGEDVLYASVVVGDEMPRVDLAGVGMMFDISTTATRVPPWWQVGSGMCRAYGVGVHTSDLAASGACVPWYRADGDLSREALGVTSFIFPLDALQILINCGGAIPAGSEVTLPPGPQEYLVGRIRILHVKTTGAGSCTGCLVPTCIGFGQVRLEYPQSTQYVSIGSPASAVTWQGAYVSSYAPVPGHPDLGGYIGYTGNLGCSTGPVPARGRTWGLIKTLYR